MDSLHAVEVTLDPSSPLSSRDTLTCKLRVIPNSPIRISHWAATLVSESRSAVFFTTMRAENFFNKTRDSASSNYYSNRGYASRIVCQDGADFKEEKERRITGVTDLSPIDLRMPDYMPDTWSDAVPSKGAYIVDRYIRYKLLTEVTYSATAADESTTMFKETEVVVKNRVDITHFERKRKSSTSTTRKSVGFPPGPAMACLIVPIRTIVQGEPVLTRVRMENNSNNNANRVTLSLIQEVQYRNDHIKNIEEGSWTLEETVAQVNLPQLTVGNTYHDDLISLIVPHNCLTSGSFVGAPHFFVRFFVRLNLKWCVGTITSNVEIFLGTMRLPSSPAQEPAQALPGPSGKDRPREHSPPQRRSRRFAVGRHFHN